jgi:hypothetical protein
MTFLTRNFLISFICILAMIDFGYWMQEDFELLCCRKMVRNSAETIFQIIYEFLDRLLLHVLQVKGTCSLFFLIIIVYGTFKSDLMPKQYRFFCFCFFFLSNLH